MFLNLQIESRKYRFSISTLTHVYPMDLVNRLKFYMDSIKVPITQFADNCGIPRPSLSQLMNGRNKRISDEVINKIHNAYPELSIMWLMFGEGEMLKPSNIEISEPQNGNLGSETGENNVDNQGFGLEQEPSLSFLEERSENLDEYSTADIRQSNFENSLFDGPMAMSEPQTREKITFNSVEPKNQTETLKSEDVTRTLYNQSVPSSASPSNVSSDQQTVSITPDSHKKITNIVVFYSDNSFQSFLPDA